MLQLVFEPHPPTPQDHSFVWISFRCDISKSGIKFHLPKFCLSLIVWHTYCVLCTGLILGPPHQLNAAYQTDVALKHVCRKLYLLVGITACKQMWRNKCVRNLFVVWCIARTLPLIQQMIRLLESTALDFDVGSHFWWNEFLKVILSGCKSFIF